MDRVCIVLLAAAGVVWNVDPMLRPYIDVAMWTLFAGLMFTLGARLDDWLCHLAARPHWRRVRRPR
jgi:hypothetical protein